MQIQWELKITVQCSLAKSVTGTQLHACILSARDTCGGDFGVAVTWIVAVRFIETEPMLEGGKL